jgi:hypothetical protein
VAPEETIVVAPLAAGSKIFFMSDPSAPETKTVPFFSKPHVDRLPELGNGRHLFEQIDVFQAEEKISPQLAEAMRKTLTAIETGHKGALEQLSTKGGARFAVTQAEGILVNITERMQKEGKCDQAIIISEWMKFVLEP